MNISTALKEKFISDVESIFVENSLTMNSLRLTQESDVSEILLLSITLRKQNFDGKIIEAIAGQNAHKLIFLLSFEGKRQLALFHDKIYMSQWISGNEISLSAQGFSLKEIWDGFIEQIALTAESVSDSLTIDKRLDLQERIVGLNNLIQRTEAAKWRERQPKKRFILHQKLQRYKKELENLKLGKS